MAYQTIKEWPQDDQPREKLLKHGPAYLTDTELLTILFRFGWHGRSAFDLARELLALNDFSLQQLGQMRLARFQKVFGNRPTYWCTFQAALELGRRRESIEVPPGAALISSKAAVDYLRPLLKDRLQEEVVGLYLNQAGIVIRKEWLSKGSMTSAVTDIRLIMRAALECGACSIIICHNHPSGSLQPSKSDIEFTHRLASAASLLDLRLLDHIIVSSQGAFSFADHRMLEPKDG